MHPDETFALAAELKKLGGKLTVSDHTLEVFRIVEKQYPLDSNKNSCYTLGSYITGGRMNAKGVQPPLYTAIDFLTAGLEYLGDRIYKKILKYADSNTTEAITPLIINALFPQPSPFDNHFLLYRLKFKAVQSLNLIGSTYANHILADDSSIIDRKSPTPSTPPCGSYANLSISYSRRFGLAAFFNGPSAVIRPSARVQMVNEHFRNSSQQLDISEHYAVDVFCPFVADEIQVEGPLDPREL